MFRRMFKSREMAILNSGSSLVITSPANDIIHLDFRGVFCFVKHVNTKDALICYAFYANYKFTLTIFKNLFFNVFA